MSFLVCSSAVCQFADKPIAGLLDTLNNLLEKYEVPGMMVSIVRSDTVIFSGGVGHIDIDKSEEVSEEHLFRIGSISKMFTGMAVMKLVEEGKLSLDDKIMELDPSLPIKNPWREDSPITVAMILEHTAGFDDMHLHSIYNTTHDAEPPLSYSVERHRKSLRARWKPGTKMSYSNSGYALAGYIVELVSGVAFPDYVKQEIIDPIGMSSSAFYFSSPAGIYPTSNGYKSVKGALQEEPYVPIVGGPAGSMCSNANDMSAFMQYLMKRRLNNDNLLLSEEGIDRIEAVKTSLASRLGLGNGYGLGNVNGWRKGYLFHGHNGGIDGFRSDMRYSRTADLGVAIAVNKTYNPYRLFNAIFDYYLVESVANTPLVARKIPVEVKQKIEGWYAPDNPRVQLNHFFLQLNAGKDFLIDEDKLVIVDFTVENYDTLYYSGNNNFFYEGQHYNNAVATVNGEGVPVFITANTSYVKRNKTYDWARFLGILCAFFALVVFVIFGSIYFVVNAIKKDRQFMNPVKALWGACASFLLLPLGLNFATANMLHADKISFGGMFIFLGTILFLPLSLYALSFVFRMKPGSKIFKFYYTLSAVLITVLAIFLAWNGVFGLRLWSY